jgi:uncharacterized membrane protein YqgA involved in biofilm formation
MDKTLRNTLIMILATVIIAFIGAWIQINSRISILEVQVQNDHQAFSDQQAKSDKSMKELMDKVNDIQLKVTQLNDLKQNKEGF